MTTASFEEFENGGYDQPEPEYGYSETGYDGSLGTREGEADAVGPDEPKDLNDAFKILNQAQQERAGQDGQDAGDGGQPAGDVLDGPAGDGYGDAGADQQGYDEQPEQPVGGFDYSATYNAASQSILKNAQINAHRQTVEMFKKAGVRKWNVNDLRQTDPDTGEVFFIDPDSAYKDRNGSTQYRNKLSRREAAEFVNLMNQEIDERFQAEMNKAVRQNMEKAAPSLRLLQWGQRFSTFSREKQLLLNDLLSPSAITDGQGHVIGYRADLAQAEKMADQILARQGAARARQTPQKQRSNNAPVRTPSTDPRTTRSDSGGSGGVSEPKSLGDAMRMYQEFKSNNPKGNN